MIIIPIFERPCWCINNPKVDYDFSLCQDSNMIYTNSNVPNLSPLITNIVSIACLLIIEARSYIQDVLIIPSKEE